MLQFLMDNAIQIILGAGLLGNLGVYLVRMILSNTNINQLANDIDNAVDNIQKGNVKVGKEARSRIIFGCQAIIAALKKDDGIN